MKRRLSFCFPLMVMAATCSLPVAAYAQQQAEKLPALEKLDEGEAPAVTIRPQESNKGVTERREQGKVKEVRVNTGKSSYVVKANDQPGSIQPGEGQSTATRVPQWQIMEFDLGAKKDKKEHDQAPVPAPPAAK